MRRFSHILSFFAVALFLLSAVNVAKADGVDPAVGVQGTDPPSPTLWTGSVTFTITSDPFFSDVFFIDSGMITSFLIHSDSGNLSFSPFFANETVTQISPTDAILSGFTITPQTILLAPTALDPITTSTNISGDFQFVTGSGGVGDTLTISSPEPGTLILLGTGLSALGLRRLRRNKAAC